MPKKEVPLGYIVTIYDNGQKLGRDVAFELLAFDEAHKQALKFLKERDLKYQLDKPLKESDCYGKGELGGDGVPTHVLAGLYVHQDKNYDVIINPIKASTVRAKKPKVVPAKKPKLPKKF
jgi:hypothetical protein